MKKLFYLILIIAIGVFILYKMEYINFTSKGEKDLQNAQKALRKGAVKTLDKTKEFIKETAEETKK